MERISVESARGKLRNFGPTILLFKVVIEGMYEYRFKTKDVPQSSQSKEVLCCSTTMSDIACRMLRQNCNPKPYPETPVQKRC
jgi:hypothetical protein